LPIEHISDTARWVAVHRAIESERRQPVFRDPFARRLAGERGAAIARDLPRGVSMAWTTIVRTAVFDEMILDVVTSGHADTVVNLAAGLDARPWRLPLAPAIRWLDVDLPDLLAYKAEVLRGETPLCQYEALPADLTDPASRAAALARVSAGSERVLIVTEGLLVYLSPGQVAGLATDLAAVPPVRWWITDLASPRLLRMMNRWWGRQPSPGRVAFQFAPAEGTDFFRPFGWLEMVFRSSPDEARRLNREMPGMWLWRWVGRLSPRQRRDEFRRIAGFVLLERDLAPHGART
jgi:methyltransferase (TIGR00027 family)